jgi:hypothetical protein
MPFVDANGLEICEYEAMRLKRIARNEAYLETLGLGGGAKQKLMVTMTTAQTKRNATRPRGSTAVSRSPPTPSKPGKERRRRSKRLTNKDNNKAQAPLLSMISYNDEQERVPVVEQVFDEDFKLDGNNSSDDCDEKKHVVVVVSSSSFRKSRSKKYSIIPDWKMTKEEQMVLQRSKHMDESYLEKFKVCKNRIISH